MSHYFDCRLKGRPAGTPKSEDPTKKKRKRSKRERDLCDVKIKITEFMAGATRDDIQAHLNLQPRSSDFRAEDILARVNAEAMATAQASFDSATPPLVATKRFYTVQRVNGTGAGGTRGEQICPNHRHTLEESDRIKKNSVLRAEIKKTQKEKLPPVVSENLLCSGNRRREMWDDDPVGFAMHFVTLDNNPCEMTCSHERLCLSFSIVCTSLRSTHPHLFHTVL